MNKRNTVFVGISLIYVQDIFSSVEVSTTLSGLCRVIGVGYERTKKAWQRRGKDESVDVWDNRITVRWRIFEKEVDMVWNRGNSDFGKKIKTGGGMLGYKDPVSGRLVDKPATGRMGYNEVENKWRPEEEGQ